MPLTSNQKHFIKKNIGKTSLEDIAYELGISKKEALKFAKKILPPKKFDQILNQGTNLPPAGRHTKTDVSNFAFGKFFLDNFPVFLLLFFAILVVYLNSFGNAFVSDDLAAIPKNPDIGNFAKFVFVSPIGFFRNFLYFLAYKIGGLNPAYFRSINILFHLGTTFAIYILLSLLYKKKPVALISALLFAVHPLLVESIAWISGGPYVQYSFFFLFSLIFYILSKDKPKYYYWSMVFFLLSALSGIPGLMFPFVLFVYELSFGDIKLNWKKTIPYFSIMLIIIIVYFSGIGQRISSLSTNYYQDSSGFNNPLTQVPVALWSYLWLMIWPQKLTLYHTEMQFSPIQYGLILLVFIGLLVAIYQGWKKNKGVFFWLAFFIISLGPSLTPLKIAWVVAERYAYLGTLGIIVLFALAINYYLEKDNEIQKPLIYIFLVIITIAFSIRTIVRNIDWKDEDHLWPATVAVSPSGAPIHNNMGDVYARQGNFPKAAEEFTKATQINPGYADAFHNLANVYQQENQLDKAVENYNKALSINPRIWQSWENLAVIYFQKGDKQNALESIQKAIAINPQDQTLKGNLQQMQSAQ